VSVEMGAPGVVHGFSDPPLSRFGNKKCNLEQSRASNGFAVNGQNVNMGCECSLALGPSVSCHHLSSAGSMTRVANKQASQARVGENKILSDKIDKLS